jgi:hypothetical protein
MSERDEKRGGSGVAIGCGVMLLFVPLYVLSIGPVALLAKWNPAVQSVGIIYAPLGLLAGVCDPFKLALDWYIDLWTG